MIQRCAILVSAVISLMVGTPAAWAQVVGEDVGARGCDVAVGALCASLSALAAPPQNTVVPSISGMVARARPLVASAGTWEPAARTYGFQWQRQQDGGEWVNIPNAVGRTYVPTVADIGGLLRVQVAAHSPFGHASETSAAIGPVAPSPPNVEGLPVLHGTARRAQRLSATAGRWSPSGSLYTYQWQRDAGGQWRDIPSATSPWYALTGEDVGAQVRVRVTARNVDGATVQPSAPVGPVATAPPVNVTPPAIAGIARRTLVITAGGGRWMPVGAALRYQWQRDTGEGFTDIAGATAARLGLTSDDVGHDVRVEVTAVNEDGAVTASSTARSVAPSPPLEVVAPAVAGAPTTGSTLRATPGTFSPAGATLRYRWQRETPEGFADIAGATGSTLLLTADEVGVRVRVVVTASNVDGEVNAPSPPTVEIIETPQVITPPVISGTLLDTYTITAGPGTWAPRDAPLTYRYEWLRCPPSVTEVTSGCTVVAVTTQPAYRLVANDVSRPMAVRVSASNRGAVAVATSAITAPVEGRPLVNTARPQIIAPAGRVEAQEPLRAGVGTWSVPLTAVAYQWQRCPADETGGCVAITGARAVTYVPLAVDVGSRLVLEVTATSVGRTVTAASEPSEVVAPLPAPLSRTPPAIAGNAERLQWLRVAAPGTWGGQPTGFSYQWRRCAPDGGDCVDIDGATASGRMLQSEDVGSTLRVVVIARNAGGAGVAVSGPSAVVAATPPVNVALPTVAGVRQVGRAQTATFGTWRGGRDVRHRYIWERCDARGEGCEAIAQATEATYLPVSADADRRLRVVVTATNPDGTTQAASAATAPIVPAAPVNSSSPRITGTPTVGQELTAVGGVWTNPVTSRQIRWYRCGAICAPVGTIGAQTHTMTAADAGMRIRLTETAAGPGGTATVWAATVMGPVASATTAAAALRAGAVTQVTTATGQSLGTATASSGATLRTAGPVAEMSALAAPSGSSTGVVFRAAPRLRGRWRVWACAAPVAGDALPPCTAPRAVRAGRSARVGRLPGRRVHVALERIGGR